MLKEISDARPHAPMQGPAHPLHECASAQPHRKETVIRIAEVVEEYGLSADTLRYYERIGLLRPVRRNASGVRDYGEEDCVRISFVKCMRGANVSIEALIEYMQLFDEGDSTLEARRQILIEQRDAAHERLQRIQAGLDRLDYLSLIHI